MSETTPQDRPPEDGMRKRVPQPPSKKKLEEELNSLLLKIKEKEAEFKSLGRPNIETSQEDLHQRNRLTAQQKSLRDDQKRAIAKRKEVENQIELIRTELTKKGDGLSRLQASLQYKSSVDLEKAIKRLEYQLNTKHFKLSEENRIVREVDTLKRSRKKVVEYMQKKEEIEELRARREKLRDERTKYFNHVSTLKSEEDRVNQNLTQMKSKEDEAWARYRESGPRREKLKKEVDDLYEMRRRLIAAYNEQNQEYKREMQEIRAEEGKRRQEERKAKEAARQKAWEEYEASREPYEEERQTLGALMKYLQSLQGVDMDDSNSTPSPQPRGMVTSAIEEGTELPPDITILRKKGDSDDDLFATSAASKRKRANKRNRRHSGHHQRALKHSHQIFMQFQSLGLKPPSSYPEVSSTLRLLQGQMEQFQLLATLQKTASEAGSRGSELASSDAAGLNSDIPSISTASLLEDEIETLSLEEHQSQEEEPLHEEMQSKDEGVHSLSSNSTLAELDGSEEFSKKRESSSLNSQSSSLFSNDSNVENQEIRTDSREEGQLDQEAEAKKKTAKDSEKQAAEVSSKRYDRLETLRNLIQGNLDQKRENLEETVNSRVEIQENYQCNSLDPGSKMTSELVDNECVSEDMQVSGNTSNVNDHMQLREISSITSEQRDKNTESDRDPALEENCRSSNTGFNLEKNPQMNVLSFETNYRSVGVSYLNSDLHSSGPTDNSQSGTVEKLPHIPLPGSADDSFPSKKDYVRSLSDAINQNEGVFVDS